MLPPLKRKSPRLLVAIGSAKPKVLATSATLCAMQFNQAMIAGVGVTHPPEAWSSDEIERRLEPLYSRLKLPPGRLALMSGIESRRVWAPGTNPSGPSAISVRRAIAAAGLNPNQIGMLIHASVCRDFLEPATAAKVHHDAGLPTACWAFDVSNACLGLLNGVVQIASAIQSGLIDAGVVVGTENSRPLVESTIRSLNEDPSLTRKSIKGAFASLTIGSGSCAIVVARRELAPEATPVGTVAAHAATAAHRLCVSGTDTAGSEMTPLMETDSEELMARGIAAGVANLDQLLGVADWSRDEIDRTVCHQVGVRHRDAMLAAMGLPVDRDVANFDVNGNTGSVALPLALAHGIESGQVVDGNRVALLGIGSGINSVMIATTWGRTPVVSQ